jgi:hypothetical protein
MNMEGYTIQEMAAILGLSYTATRQRLRYKNIDAKFDGKIYDPAALDAIRDFGPKGFQPGEANPRVKSKEKPEEDEK